MAEVVDHVRVRPGRAARPAAGSADSLQEVLARYRWAALTCDAGSALAAALAAATLRFGAEVPGTFVLICGLLPLVWPTLVAVRGGHERRYLGSGPQEYRRIVQAGVLLFAVIATASFATKAGLARGFVLPVVPLTVLLTLAARHVLRARLYRARRQGLGMQRLLVLGRADVAQALAEDLRQHPEHGLLPVAVVEPSGHAGQPRVDGVPLVSDAGALVAAVHRARVGAVAVVSDPDLSGIGLRRLAWALEDLGVDLLVSPGIVEVAGPRLSVRAVAGLSLLHLERPSSQVRSLAKSLLDRVLAAPMLLAALPVLVVAGVAVQLVSPGPVLERERRIGAGSQPFWMLRLRVPDGPGAAEMWLSHLVRRYCVHELPQLMNVLNGSMSLVGPRPRLPEHAVGDSDVMRRVRVRPGLTGLRQISGGTAMSPEDMLRFDLRYVDNWSVTMDLVILLRSIRALLVHRAAA